MPSHAKLTAEEPRVDLHGAFVRRVSLQNAILVGANLSGADATNADFRGADFQDANLNGTVLKGADLRDAINLTTGQLRSAILDENTRLPDYIDPAHLQPIAQ